jgi:predicted membrane protein
MKLKNKLSIMLASLITTITTVAAHLGEEEGTTAGMMMWGDGGGWMHNAGHMAGYNMWGMGWFGLLFGLALWILVILGIIYLYQQVTEKTGDEE